MTAIALQKYIVSKIVDINDDIILEKIKKLIDSKPEKVYELTEEQVTLFNESKNQHQEGIFIDDIEMDKKVAEWQKGK